MLYMILYTTDLYKGKKWKNVVLKVDLWGWVMVFFIPMSGVRHQNFVPLRGGGSCFFEEPGFHFLRPTPPPVLFDRPLNVFLLTLRLLYRSSSSWSTGNLPLWLFWLVLPKFREKFGTSWENSGVFWKWIPEHDATVVSCHAMVLTRCTCFSLIGWFIFLEFDWLRWTVQFFLNLDTYVVAVVQVSNETIQLIISLDYWMGNS